MTPETPKPQMLTEIQKILNLSSEKKFADGDFIFEEGGEDPHFYIVLKGSVEISKKTSAGQPKVIAHVGMGEFLGEGVLSGVTRKPASARAIGETSLMQLSYGDFDTLMKEEPKTAVDFLLSVLAAESSRLNKTNAKLLALFEISQLLNQSRKDLRDLAEDLIEKLILITGAQSGMLILRKPFTDEMQVQYSSAPDLSLASVRSFDLESPQSVIDPGGQYLLVNLRQMGLIVLRRGTDFAHFDDDQLRLLTLIADQVASALHEASEKAAEKARERLMHKPFQI